MKTIEEMTFTNELKDRVYHWVTGNRSADFIDGQAVLKIQNPNGIEIVQFGDVIEKKGDGYCYLKK